MNKEKAKIDVTIVIPFHNEEESLKVLLPLLVEEIKKTQKVFEVILVNDVSRDNSVDIVKKITNEHKYIKLIELDQRGGQTGCYKAAFNQAKGDYILRMDADLQDSPNDLPLFIFKMDEGAELIMGLREARKHSRIIRIASAIYDLIILALFNSPLHSNSGSFVAFKSKYMKGLPWYHNDHRYLPLIAMHRGANNVSEVFVEHHNREFGQSKYKPFKKIFLGFPEVLCFLFRLKIGKYHCVTDKK